MSMLHNVIDFYAPQKSLTWVYLMVVATTIMMTRVGLCESGVPEYISFKQDDL